MNTAAPASTSAALPATDGARPAPARRAGHGKHRAAGRGATASTPRVPRAARAARAGGRHAAPRVPGSRRPGRAGRWVVSCAAVVAAVAGMGLVSGCSELGQHGAAQPSATVTVTATASPAVTPAASAVATATPVASASATAPTASTPPPVPTLGRVAGVFTHGTGFGSVRPAKIFNGGDPTGLVSGITWKSWGGHTAVGTGTGEYVGPGQSVATGSQARARVVAFSLGYCAGKLMYRSLEWYFPGQGQSFSSTHYQDICAGSYVPVG